MGSNEQKESASIDKKAAVPCGVLLDR